MTINTVGIQSYRQVSQQENPLASPTTKGEKPQIAEKRVIISPQNEAAGSKLAVKADVRNYADFLTPEEKSALDILFSRFKDKNRFGPGYQKDTGVHSDNEALGNLIDFKA